MDILNVALLYVLLNSVHNCITIKTFDPSRMSKTSRPRAHYSLNPEYLGLGIPYYY